MRTKCIAAAAVMGVSVHAHAVNVPHTFSSGTAARASEVNENFASLEAAINAAGSASFSGYFLSPSADGALGNRNVIVWEMTGSNCYVARVDFTNTENITVQSISGGVQPARIFVWQMACGDGGIVDYELEYVYALPSGGFSEQHPREINEDADGNGVFDNTSVHNNRLTFESNPLTSSQLVHRNEISTDANDEVLSVTSGTVSISRHPGSLTVNGITFTDVVIQNFLGFQRVRFHAQGVGAVLEVNPDRSAQVGFPELNSDPLFGGQTLRRLIFYRNTNAQPTTQGSIAGTPFASGDLINQWFQAP